MSDFPNQLDANANLFLVHDGLRVTLIEDYNPGDTSIIVDIDPRPYFPPTGLITLTDQCTVIIENRAISFSYTGMTASGFTGLTLMSGFTDVVKPKQFTHVTMNVMGEHHNSLKDAVIAIENTAGKRGEVALMPLTGTMEERINFLRQLVLQPKAWFGVDKRTGIVPIAVNFKDLSLRAPTKYVWDFGDGSSPQTITFPYVPGEAEGTTGTAPDGSISHTYTIPGSYDIQLSVTNPFGTNTITISEMITARTLAPDPAEIEFIQGPTQIVNSEGVIRSRINTPIQIMVTDNGEQALDPITTYTWNMADDLLHPSLSSTEAQYSVGGLYDIRLRVDTTLESYRITTFPQVIDIIENNNVWFSVFDPNASDMAITKDVFTYEFGLISEVFKSKSFNPLSVTRDYSFLIGLPNEDQQIQEFRHNNGFTPRTMVSSGDRGTAMMYWQESQDTIRMSEFNGFDDTYASPQIGSSDNSILRTWNWVSLNSPQNVYFLFGNRDPAIDLTNPDLQKLDLGDLTLSGELLHVNSFENGSEELLTNVGDGTSGEFSVYRSCWKDSTGYITRNDGTGLYFRLKSFYRTQGILSEPVKSFMKLPDLPGEGNSPRTEGQLVSLTDGVYFFNNTGEVAVYDPITNVWASGGPGVGSPAFNVLQDNSISGFDNPSNILVAAGDGDRIAYLGFDYSNKTFIKFNSADRTFNRLPDRPQGEQFMMSVF